MENLHEMLQSYNTSESHWLGAHVNVRLNPSGFMHGGAGVNFINIERATFL